MSADLAPFTAALEADARASGLVLTQREVEACRAHYGLLVLWNKTHNLTRVTDPQEAVRKHYLDCLVPLKTLVTPPEAFVDVGSGAGFPGLLAALCWPDARAFLVEPAQKRVSFLTLAAGAMGIKVAVVSPGAPEARAPVVLSRATFSQGQRGALKSYVQTGRGPGSEGAPSSGPWVAAGREGTKSAELAVGDAQIMVWGHPHDDSTWKSEVETWGSWGARWVSYRVHGLEERALLQAMPRGQ